VIPAISLPMEGSTIIVNESSTCTIDCEAAGFPQFTVVWEKVDGSDHSLSISEPVTNRTTNTVSVSLKVTNVSREISGEYRCLARNSVGGVNRTVHLVVQCKFPYLLVI